MSGLLWITASAVPSAYLFQLSAVPILNKPLSAVLVCCISVTSCGPVKLPRYSASDPTVTAYTCSLYAGANCWMAAKSAWYDCVVSGLFGRWSANASTSQDAVTRCQ